MHERYSCHGGSIEKPNIYLACIQRKNLIIPALSRRFNVIDGSPQTARFSVKYVLNTILRLRRIRRKSKLIVMTNGLNPNLVAVGLIARLLRIPFFIRLRGGLWREIGDKAQKSLWQRFYYKVRLRLTLKLANGVLPVSDFLCNQLQSNNHNMVKVRRVYNSIDGNIYKDVEYGRFRARLQLLNDAKIILTISNFNYYKKYLGVVYYLPSILRVLEERNNWVFVIVGDGYSFNKAQATIKGMVSDSLQERVIFTGYYKPIEEALMDADIVINLAFRETLGMTILQAQAAGKPVIANDFGGMTELLREHPLCLVKGNGDLRRALLAFIDDATLRERLGAQNRDKVAMKFNAEIIGDDFYEAITNIIRQ